MQNNYKVYHTFSVCNSAFLTFSNEIVHRDGLFFNRISNAYSSNHLWDSYWTEQDIKKIKRKCSNWTRPACTGLRSTQARAPHKHAGPWMREKTSSCSFQ